MSINFWCPLAPEVISAVYDCCDRSECLHCHGDGKVVFHEPKGSVNVSNSNAFDLLEALGLPVESCGTVKLENIPDFRRRIVRANQHPEALAIEASQGTGERGCLWYSQGRTTAYITRRLGHLDALARIAQECEGPIHWG